MRSAEWGQGGLGGYRTDLCRALWTQMGNGQEVPSCHLPGPNSRAHSVDKIVCRVPLQHHLSRAGRGGAGGSLETTGASRAHLLAPFTPTVLMADI